MAIKGRSEEQKAALAEIVASETLLDIEEYIRPKFPPKRASSELLSSIPNVSLNVDARRRIVQDGHGRWREVKPRLYSSNLQSYLPAGRVKLKEQQIKGVNGLGHRSGSSCGNTFGNYNNLSMSLRSNVFPGLGNNEWNSTTTKVFKKQPVIPSTERDKFFGIQTDEFGQWSAANVHHETMKKKWDAYLESLPKQAVEMKHELPKAVIPKMENPPPPQAKVKKTNLKPKPQKKEQKPPSTENTVMLPPEENAVQPPLPPPIDIPADDNDDNFWDFYDKPFNKPN